MIQDKGKTVSLLNFKTMKSVIATTKLGKEVKVGLFSDKGYSLVSEENFEKTYSGRTNDGRVFEDFKVGDNFIQKTYPSWNQSGRLSFTQQR